MTASGTRTGIDESVWETARARAWHRFMPPDRPSREEIAYYQRSMHAELGNGDGRALLIGSTPELRGIAHRQGWALTAIDANPAVYHELEMLVEPRGTTQFLAGDWLETTHAQPYDLVLADCVINRLPATHQGNGIVSLANAVRSGGVALLRVHLHAQPEFASAAEVFSWYIRYGSGEPVYSATRTHLDMLWMDPNTLSVDFQKVHQRLHQMFQRGELLEGHYQAYDSLLTYNHTHLHYLEHAAFDALCAPFFELERILHGRDYTGAEQHPICVLRRR